MSELSRWFAVCWLCEFVCQSSPVLNPLTLLNSGVTGPVHTSHMHSQHITDNILSSDSCFITYLLSKCYVDWFLTSLTSVNGHQRWSPCSPPEGASRPQAPAGPGGPDIYLCPPSSHRHLMDGNTQGRRNVTWRKIICFSLPGPNFRTREGTKHRENEWVNLSTILLHHNN